MKFSIEAVSKMTGVASVSLRNWEKRYGFPLPERSTGGHRCYCAYDIEFVNKAIQWMSEGQSLAEIAKRYRQCPEQELKIVKPELVDDVSYRAELIYKSLLEFNCAETLQHYRILNAKLSPEILFDRVFEVVIRKLGEDWMAGKITIAQERFASSFLRARMSAFLAIDFPPTQSHKVLIAAIPKENHEGGLLLLHAQLKFRGYPVFYFGSNMPMSELFNVVQSIKPSVVCLGYCKSEWIKADFPELLKLQVPVCIGGAALRDCDSLDTLVKNAPKNFHFCSPEKSSSEASQYVEMVCRGT